MRFNGDTTNYSRSYITLNDTSFNGTKNVAQVGIILSNSHSIHETTRSVINLKNNGQYRTAYSNISSIRNDNPDTWHVGISSNFWENDSDKITSIRIYTGGSNLTGTFRFFKRVNLQLPVSNLQKGKQSLQVEYATASGIYINPGEIHMANSTYGMYELNDRTEVTVSGLAADTWYYVYVDVSNATSALDSADFTVSSGIPTISYPKMGYYNGNNRCIGFFYSDSSADVYRFNTRRGRYNFYKWIGEKNSSMTGYEDITHTVPFGDLTVDVHIYAKKTSSASQINMLWPGDTDPNFIMTGLLYCRDSNEESVSITYDVDENKQIRFWSEASGVDVTTDAFNLRTIAFYLPDYIYTGA